MSEKSTKNQSKSDFNSLIPNYSDQEILEILKKRNFYQPEAAELAIKEAIKRGLIYSKQDLVAEEFRPKPMRYRLFPIIDKEHQKNKIRKSIARGLIVAGVLPSVWGFIQFIKGLKFEGGILAILGIIWIFLSLRLYKRFVPAIIRILFTMLFVSVIYIVKILISLESIVFMDVFVLVMVYSLIIYGLLFVLNIKQ